MSTKNGKVSIIIPAYNVQQYIEECLQSLLEQTYNNFEIIIVNDGSTDETLSIIKGYESKYDFIRVIDISNHGQGYARNLALKEAKGEYVLFMDSDDFLEKVTLQVAVERIKEDKSDFVLFDWKYYFDKSSKYKYTNTENFFDKRILQDDEVVDLLTIKHYFTVNKLYSKEFLLKNKIKYGEGYIYEDIPFWAKVVTCASKVSLIHSPLYTVRVNATSTTKTKINTDRHYKGFIKAMEETIKITKKKPKYDYYDLYNYLINKFNLYYIKRTPYRNRIKFLCEFVDQMSVALPPKQIKRNNILLRLGFKYNIFKNKKKVLFYLLYKLFAIKNFFKAKVKKIRKSCSKILDALKCELNQKCYQLSLKHEKQSSILFMGFDYRYTGNSRYLFEALKANKQIGDNKLFFVTEDNLVEDKYKIKPNSKEMYDKLYNSKVVIFESWIPKQFIKPEDSIWIQLWHGTPLKKMLFDSEEAEIIVKNKRNKINKYNDINKWDYLLLDNKKIYKYFETSFLMPESKTVAAGYPRVKYLIDNINNKKLKDEIRNKAKIDKNKKIILYLPTWRDYNYGKDEENTDFEYFLDCTKLQKELGEDYIIVSKNHTFMNNKDKDTITNVDIETQELVLIADYLITDYSSVMFDAFAIDLPVVILAKDYDKYQKSRGVYQSMWKDLLPIVTYDEQETAKQILNYKIDSKEYKRLKEEYAYNAESDLINLILKECVKGE